MYPATISAAAVSVLVSGGRAVVRQLSSLPAVSGATIVAMKVMMASTIR
jgi:hypothetical protein